MVQEIIDMWDFGFDVNFIVNRIYGLVHNKFILKNSNLINDTFLNYNSSRKDVYKFVIKTLKKHCKKRGFSSYGVHFVL